MNPSDNKTPGPADPIPASAAPIPCPENSGTERAGPGRVGLGSARVSRAGFGVPPNPITRRDAGQHTRNACALRKNTARFLWGGLLAAALALAGCGEKHNHADHANHAAAHDDHDDPKHAAHDGGNHAAHSDHNHAAHAVTDHAEHSGHEHAAHDGDETGQSVSFKEGQGLLLSPEVIRALAIKTGDAEVRPLAAEWSVSAQIIATTPRLIASARVPEAEAAALEKASAAGAKLLLAQASPVGAKLLLADRSSTPATRFVDLVYELALPPTPASSAPSAPSAPSVPPPAPETGSFVTLALTGAPATVLAVPRSAVLETAAGAFVYVVKDDAFLRTPVRTGGRSPALVEITDGLRAGAVVVVSSVEQLWLAELRLTKGGGHSH